MFIYAGFLTFKLDLVPEGLPLGWKRSLPLSTFSPPASPNFDREPGGDFCDLHSIARSATGICYICDLDD